MTPVSWLSDEQAAAYEHDASASWERDYATDGGSHACQWCGAEAEPDEVRVSASKWLRLCLSCRTDLVAAFTPNQGPALQLEEC